MLIKRVLLGAVVIIYCPTAAGAVTLASHRAIYDLEISRLDSGSGYSNVEGRLAYELTGSACEGWAVNYRIANRYVLPEKPAQILDTQLTTWESGDGLEMNLSQKQFVDSSLDSEERINVKRPKLGAEAHGEMTKPKDEEFTVAGEALFPSTHQTKLLNAALNGESRDVSLVFDGSDGSKTYKAISFIGRKRAPGSFSVDQANSVTEPLRGIASWPMTVSYYPAEGGADTPSYQSSFNMYENGVSTDLVLDYGTYALKGKLSKLDMLKADTCK
jgi:EipB-like